MITMTYFKCNKCNKEINEYGLIQRTDKYCENCGSNEWIKTGDTGPNITFRTCKIVICPKCNSEKPSKMINDKKIYPNFCTKCGTKTEEKIIGKMDILREF